MRDSDRVFITGGSGFIGRAWTRDHPNRVTILGRDEERLMQARAKAPFKVNPIRGDVTDRIEVLAGYFSGHDILIHAAATKHVDRCEYAPLDTVRINVEGTRNIGLAAIAAGVKVAVLISTDKAVEPANVYGASKMLAERIWLELGTRSSTRFAVVRYGNVIGSTGSVLPKLRAQAERRAPLTITNANMTRFWVSPSMAVDLIDTAIEGDSDGSFRLPPATWVMRPGAALIGESIVAAIGCELEQYGPGVTHITRPGEKLNETMFTAVESVSPLFEGTGGLPEAYTSAKPDDWWAVHEIRAILDAAAKI